MATPESLLEACEASIERILATDVEEWEEKDRRAQHIRLKELQAFRDQLKAEVATNSGRRIIGPVRRVNI